MQHLLSTPHVTHRSQEEAIAKQLLNSKLDLALGEVKPGFTRIHGKIQQMGGMVKEVTRKIS